MFEHGVRVCKFVEVPDPAEVDLVIAHIVEQGRVLIREGRQSVPPAEESPLQPLEGIESTQCEEQMADTMPSRVPRPEGGVCEIYYAEVDAELEQADRAVAVGHCSLVDMASWLHAVLAQLLRVVAVAQQPVLLIQGIGCRVGLLFFLALTETEQSFDLFIVTFDHGCEDNLIGEKIICSCV